MMLWVVLVWLKVKFIFQGSLEKTQQQFAPNTEDTCLYARALYEYHAGKYNESGP